MNRKRVYLIQSRNAVLLGRSECIYIYICMLRSIFQTFVSVTVVFHFRHSASRKDHSDFAQNHQILSTLYIIVDQYYEINPTMLSYYSARNNRVVPRP